MAYCIYIQRHAAKISRDEWVKYIKEDADFELINNFKAELETGHTLVTGIPYAGLWKKEIPFVYVPESGHICVYSPDINVIEKMITISKKMNAIVIGEEDELYDDEFIKKEKHKPRVNWEDYKNLSIKLYNPNKKWWQFWKKGTHL